MWNQFVGQGLEGQEELIGASDEEDSSNEFESSEKMSTVTHQPEAQVTTESNKIAPKDPSKEPEDLESIEIRSAADAEYQPQFYSNNQQYYVANAPAFYGNFDAFHNPSSPVFSLQELQPIKRTLKSNKNIEDEKEQKIAPLPLPTTTATSPTTSTFRISVVDEEDHVVEEESGRNESVFADENDSKGEKKREESSAAEGELLNCETN